MSNGRLSELRKCLEQKEARLAVIGLGYVGLPVAAMLADIGFDVIGVEIRAERVRLINGGGNPIEGSEPGLSELIAQSVKSRKFRATTDFSELKDRDVILINVETPVDEHNIPQYDALRAVLKNLGSVLKDGVLIIVESTIAPGTMNEIVRPLLEQSSGKRAGVDFFLGHCPERVMPGKLLQNLRTLSRVVGGMTPETAETMLSLYRHIVQADLDPVDCITAELVKTVENTYRDVQIAFANEVALICEAVGADVWKVREFVNKSPYRQMHLPGAGVGGHCIPKDPWLLAHSASRGHIPLRIIPNAREVNDSMPLHMIDLLAKSFAGSGQAISRARIAVLGFAYLEDSDDSRNSPSEVLVTRLREMGATVVIHDPWIAEYRGDLMECVAGADAAVLMVAHTAFRELDLRRLASALRMPILIDGRHCFNPATVQAAGLSYRCLGTA
jgi:UDP-N-acetyl-D-mannosaminuronic acid dehydrogenase